MVATPETRFSARGLLRSRNPRLTTDDADQIGETPRKQLYFDGLNGVAQHHI
jgi:hypothetical protein